METTGNVDKSVFIKYKQTEKEISKLEETVGRRRGWRPRARALAMWLTRASLLSFFFQQLAVMGKGLDEAEAKVAELKERWLPRLRDIVC